MRVLRDRPCAADPRLLPAPCKSLGSADGTRSRRLTKLCREMGARRPELICSGRALMGRTGLRQVRLGRFSCSRRRMFWRVWRPCLRQMLQPVGAPASQIGRKRVGLRAWGSGGVAICVGARKLRGGGLKSGGMSVYRNGQSWGHSMRHIAISAFLGLMLVAGCDATTGRSAVVKGTGPDEFLKLRAGPGLGFRIVMGLPDGTRLTRHGCVTELGQLWCQVSLAAAPGVKGYVSADYLTAP